MKKQDAEDLFEIVCKDAQSWLAQARQLKISADIIKAELLNEIPIMRGTPGGDERFIALMDSFMLLTGMAFENLIKGILIGRDPSLVNRQVINDKILTRGGHGISEGAKKVCAIDNSEYFLLKRLEEYSFWAGKYPMPLKSGVYLNSQNPVNLRSLRESDFELIEMLFNRLAEILVEEWQARERS
jgi:hypothetical protein